MPSRASTSLLRATVLCQSSWGYTCQCPLGLVPHCYVRSAVVHSVNKDGVSMPSRASTSLLLFRSVKDLRVINSYVSMPSRASTSLLPAILGNIGRMTSLCQCPLGLVPHCYAVDCNDITHQIIRVSMPSRASTSLLQYPFKNLGFMRFPEPVFAGIYQNILTIAVFRAC